MTYDQQLEAIRALGVADKHIRRVRYHTLKDGRSVPVCERNSDGTMQETLYRLNSGKLEDGEFWMLRYYDDQGIWQEVVGDEPREPSTPAEILNQMLSELRMYEQTEALETLAKAIELTLQGEDHPRHRLKAEAIMSGSKLPDLQSLEALSLAFQAGELMERFGLNYRGVMDNARKGVSFSSKGGGRKSRHWDDLKEWEQALATAWKDKPNNDTLGFLNAMEAAKAIQWDEASGNYKFRGGDWITDDSAKKRVRRFLKKLESGEISIPS